MKGLILMNILIFLIVILPLSDIYMKDNDYEGAFANAKVKIIIW